MNRDKVKTMVVTGAAGGLGSALSKVAAANGWQVIMIDRDKRALERHYDAIVSAGGTEPFLHPLDLSVSGPADFELLARALRVEFKGLNALVHCAVSFTGLQPLDLIEPQDWLEQIQVNVNAPWLLSVHLLPLLRLRSSASLIFVLDEQANSKALWGAYGVSKSAIQALAAQFRAELNNSQICVHAVDPGPMRTSLRASVFHSENPTEVTPPEIGAKLLLFILDQNNKQRELIVRLQN